MAGLLHATARWGTYGKQSGPLGGQSAGVFGEMAALTFLEAGSMPMNKNSNIQGSRSEISSYCAKEKPKEHPNQPVSV
jgi:hypothetical protein